MLSVCFGEGCTGLKTRVMNNLLATFCLHFTRTIRETQPVRQIFASCRLRHAHVRKDTRLSLRFSVLQATESWAGPGNEATWYTLFAHAPSSLGNLHTTPLHKNYGQFCLPAERPHCMIILLLRLIRAVFKSKTISLRR